MQKRDANNSTGGESEFKNDAVNADQARSLHLAIKKVFEDDKEVAHELLQNLLQRNKRDKTDEKHESIFYF